MNKQQTEAWNRAFGNRDKWPKKKKSPANALTQAIVDFIRMDGGIAYRISSEGRVIETKSEQTSMSVSGQLVTKPTKGFKRIPSSQKRGLPDIIAIKPLPLPTEITEEGILSALDSFGLFVGIEVKIGKDTMSQHQLDRKEEIEKAGGRFIIAKDIAQFTKDWEELN